MAFPFPLNPTDGQVATQAQADGTVLKATYIQAKNEWVVERVLPKNPSITLTAGTPYIVPPGNDGQVLTFDAAANQWIGKAPTAAGGGGGGTFSKGKATDPDTPNPPDPTKPRDMLKPGMLQSTLENLHHELKAWDGTAWAEVFTEDQIKQWIAAGSLFRSTLQQAGIAGLPASATSNRGYYWTWAGNSGYVVQAGDTPLAPDLTGEVLNPGDWLQSDGTKYVHVSGDLLSKQRWLSLGGFQPWSDTSWESGSIVSYQKSFFRATSNIVAGDAPPGDGSAGNKWQDITPLPRMGLEDLRKVNANVQDPDLHGAVFQWDDNVNEWVASDTLQIGAVRFDDAGIGAEITGFADLDFNQADPADDGSYVPSVYAVKEYIKAQPKPFLEELDDCGELAKATDGQVPVWSDTNSRWEPKTLTSPIIYLGTGGWTAANVASKPDNYGMAADTQPDPKIWAPQPGDQYIDLATGNVTVFTDPGGTTSPASPPPDRNAPGIAGGNTPADLIPDRLGDLDDVTLSTPATGNLLRYNTDHWENWVPDYLNPANGYTKTEVDSKISAVVTGLEHEAAVLSRVDTPPAAPSLEDTHIVGSSPTGLWAGQANQLARWDGAAWQFAAPRTNESHLVEAEDAIYHWNGTAWVKVANASVAGSVANGSIWMVGSIQQSLLTEQQFKTALGPAEESKWVLADGRDVSTTAYATITGRTHVPDLRGAFLRMAGQNATNTSWVGGTLGAWQEDTTRRPRTADFTTSTNGNHTHNVWSMPSSNGSWWDTGQGIGTAGGNLAYGWRYSSLVQATGSHSHTITGGGDTETRPKSYAVNYFLKVN